MNEHPTEKVGRKKKSRGIPSKKNPPWWPTAEQKRHADAGCAHPDLCRVPSSLPSAPTTGEVD